MAALKRSEQALATYRAFTPGRKRDETRKKRIATAVEWMAEGKERNWKYRAC